MAQAGRDQLAGRLKLGVIFTIAPYLLPDLIHALHEHAPQMPLEIEENLTRELEGALKAGRIDAAIVALPFAPPGIVTEPLYEEPFEIVVPRGHPWARRRCVAADELASEHAILLNVGHCFRDQVLDACREFTRPPTQGKQGNSLETIRNMVTSGMGISVLPATALGPKYATPLVKAIDFTPPAPSRRIVLAWRDAFPRRAALAVIAAAIPKLGLPISAERATDRSPDAMTTSG